MNSTRHDGPTLTLVHVNDFHAHYDPRGGSPVARAVGFKRRVEREQPNVLFINAGDDYEKGSVAENFSRGRSTLEITHAARYDIRALGNHDFAWDEQQVLEYATDPHGDVVCGNVSYAGPLSHPWNARRVAVREVAGVRVGFFGFVSKPWNEKNEQVDGDFFPTFPMRHDYEALAREVVAEARATCDLVVMVSHLGLPTDRALCEAIEGIDVVIGAHSHHRLARPERVGNARIVQTGCFGRYVGRLDLELDAETRRIVGERYALVPLSEGFAPVDEEMQRTIEAVYARHAPEAHRTVGETSRALSKEDTMRLSARAAVAVGEVEAALIHPRPWWCGLPHGAVNAQDFCDACKIERQPAGTPSWTGLYSVTMDGAELAAARDALHYAGPEPVPGRRYRVATTRFVAEHPAEYLPRAESVRDAAPLIEVWRLLFLYAQHRTERGLCVDADVTLSGWTGSTHTPTTD